MTPPLFTRPFLLVPPGCREAKEEIESLHRDQVAAAQERVHWQRRDGEFSAKKRQSLAV